jgi:hypothetical protein
MKKIISFCNVIKIMENFKDKKSQAVSVRMTPMERMLIESRAKDTGMSMSSYMVLCSLGKELKLLSKEQKTSYKHLATYHSHFSRIGSLVRNRADITAEVSEVIREIKKQLDEIRNGQ